MKKPRSFKYASIKLKYHPKLKKVLIDNDNPHSRRRSIALSRCLLIRLRKFIDEVLSYQFDEERISHECPKCHSSDTQADFSKGLCNKCLLRWEEENE